MWRTLAQIRSPRRAVSFLATTLGVALLTQAGVGACKPLENPCPAVPFDASAYPCGWDPCWVDCDNVDRVNGACLRDGIHCVECEPLRAWLETCTQCEVDWEDDAHVRVSCITNNRY